MTTVEDHWVVDDVTLSGFTVEGPYGPANPESYKNTKDGQHHSMIVAAGTRDLSVNAISIKDSISHALTVANSVDANISNIVIDGAHNKGTQGNGYGLWIRDVYDSRFTELDIVDVRHAVLFASWTSASGNYVHVSDTNRDINFHGGRDQFNTVVVDVMRVNDASSNAPGKEVFFNEGEVYGAPTDASVNEVLIRSSVAQVYEHHEVETDGRVRWRGDEIFTGAGDDYAAGGSGADTIYASDGDDAIDGGAGFDVLVLPGLRADYLVTKDDDALYFDRSNDTTWAHQVESFRFRDMTLSASDLRATALLENKTVDNPDTAVEGAGEIGPEDPTGGTDGGTGGGVFDVNGLIPATHLGWESMDVSVLDKVSGSERWERIWIDTSSKIDGTVEAVSMAGSAHLVVVGNSGDNQMAGNHGDNRLEGRNGDDKIFGKNGNDTLLGGKGDDDLDGGTENDQLDGGLGDDTIEGGGGDDTIRASAGEDWVDGENGEADLIIFSKTTRDFTVRMEDDDVYQFTEGANTTYIEAVEMFAFTNGTFSLDEIDAWIATGVSPDQDPNNPDPPLPDFDFDLVSPL
ncbi:MAG: calcium-binding protein [Primorskyibacter sp.]